MAFRPVRSRGEILKEQRQVGQFDPNSFRPVKQEEEEDSGFFSAARDFAFGKDSTFGDAFGDFLMAPLRGAEGFVKSVYGLGDTLLGDILPDYDDRLLGQSKTGLGGFVEGTSEFLLGFIPIVGWVGRGAKLKQLGQFGLKATKTGQDFGRVGRAGQAIGLVDDAGRIRGTRHAVDALDKTGRKLGFADGAGGFKPLKGLSDEAIGAAEGRGFFGFSPLKRSTHLSLRRAAVAGAITDFAAFDGHEERLSNLAQQFGIETEITDFLAAKEDDPELLGRLKNAIEGVFLGVALDVGMSAIKGGYHALSKTVDQVAQGVVAVKRGREAKDLGASAQEVDTIVNETASAGIRNSNADFSASGNDARQFVGERERNLFSGEDGKDLTELRKFLDLGAAQDDSPEWFNAASRAIGDVTKGNVDDAERLAHAIALLDGNFDAGVRAYSKAKSGASREAFVSPPPGHADNFGTPEKMEELAKGLFDNAPFSGNNKALYDGLVGGVDPGRVRGAPVEPLLARAMGMESDALGVGGSREALQETVADASKRLGWEDAESEAALALYGRDVWKEIGPEVRAAYDGEGAARMSNPKFREFYGQKMRDRMRQDFPLDGSPTSKAFEDAIDKQTIKLRNQPEGKTGFGKAFDSLEYKDKLQVEMDLESALKDPQSGADLITAALKASGSSGRAKAHRQLRKLFLQQGGGSRAIRQELKAAGHGDALKQLDNELAPRIQQVQQKWAQRSGVDVPKKAAAPRKPFTKESGIPYDSKAQRLVDSSGKPAVLNDDGTITLFLRTSVEEANKLFSGKASDGPVHVTTDSVGLSDGTGNVVVEMRVAPDKVKLLKQHGDGIDVEIPFKDIPQGAKVTAGDPRTRILKRLDIGTEEAEAILKDIDNRVENAFDPGINPREKNKDGSFVHSREELLAMRLQRVDMNLSHFEGEEGALQLLRTYESLFRGMLPEADIPTTQRPITFTEQEAQSLQHLTDMAGGRDPVSMQAGLITDLKRDNMLMRNLNARVLAYKSMLLSYGTRVAKLADAARAGSDKNAMEFLESATFLADLQAGVKGLISEQGRGLGSNRLPVRELALDPDALRQAVSEAGGIDNARKLADQFKSAFGDGGVSGTAAVGRLARIVKGRLVPRVLLEYWMNSILSGLKTLTVNLMGNAITTVYRPLESILGGVIARDADVIHDAIREIVYTVQGTTDALRMAVKAGVENRGIIDPANRKFDLPDAQRFAITPENFGVDDNPWLGPLVKWLGKTVRFPGAALQGTDEFFKQINFRGKLRSDLVRKGLKDGMNANDAALFAVEEMDKFFFQGQAYSRATEYRAGLDDAKKNGITDPALAQNHASNYTRDNFDPERGKLSSTALDRAEEVTFTKPLPPGSLSAKLQEAVIAHPFLRLFVPFVRTPMNILTFAGQRFDVIGAAQVLSSKAFPAKAKALQSSQRRLVQDIISGDPRKKADAIGRFSMGMGMGWAFTSMAAEGRITGRGPSDPEQKRILQESGWQPYSFKTDEGYVSYQRLDPFATIIGVAADAIGYGRWADVDEQEQLETVMMGIGVALANNVTNKSYLTGISKLVEALQAPDRNLERVISGLAASVVPSILAQSVVTSGDTALRDLQGISDAIANRIPFYSDSVDPVRNVLGEEVKRSRSAGADTIGSIMDMWQPIAYREVTDDVIFTEMANLKHGFAPPRATKTGVDLRAIKRPSGQSAYDRWLQLHGTVTLGGKTLQVSLRQLMESEGYNNLSPFSTHEVDSPRIALVRRLIGKYRRAAWAQLQKEVPEVRARVAEVTTTRGNLRAGIDTRLLPDQR